MCARSQENDFMVAKRSRCWLPPFWLALVLIAAPTPAARAALQFQVTVNNPQALNRNPLGAGGPYALDFTLTSGGNTNTVIINSFNLGGGSALSSMIFMTGGASGDINSPPGSITVTDNVQVNPGAGAFNDFNEVFAPGTLAVAFAVNMTTSFVSGTPDRFTLSILDQTGNPIPTTDTGNNNEFALLGANITGPSMTLSNIETYTAGSGANQITVSVSPFGSIVPEPATVVPMCLGIGTVLGWYALHHRRTTVN
jgi:hypothetical protein